MKCPKVGCDVSVLRSTGDKEHFEHIEAWITG